MLLRIGVSAAEAGDDVRARAALEECCAVDPAYDRAWLWLASVAGSPVAAMGHLRKVLQLEPGHPLATSTLERLLLHDGMEAAMAGDRGLATEYLTEASQLNPANEQVWALLAQLAPDDNARVEALERALAVSPDSERLRATLESVRSRQEVEERLEAEALHEAEMLVAAETAAAATDPEPAIEVIARVEPVVRPTTVEPIASEPAVEPETVTFGDTPGTSPAEEPAKIVAADSATQPRILYDPYDRVPETRPKRARPAVPTDASAAEPPAPAPRAAPTGRSAAKPALDRSSIEWPEIDLVTPRQPTTIVVTQQPARRPVEASAAPAVEPPAPRPAPMADPAPLVDPTPPVVLSPSRPADKPRPMVVPHASFDRLAESSVVPASAQPSVPPPFAPEAAGGAWTLRPPADGTTRVGGQPLVMVIDDSPTIRKAVSIGLEAEGYHVVTAVDSVDALRRLEETQPDLILLDITMPGMDGYKLCRKIRSMERTKAIPVVMLSGKDGFFDKVRGRMAGCTDYITKPFASRVLLDTVAQHCGAAR